MIIDVPVFVSYFPLMINRILSPEFLFASARITNRGNGNWEVTEGGGGIGFTLVLGGRGGSANVGISANGEQILLKAEVAGDAGNILGHQLSGNGEVGVGFDKNGCVRR